MEAIIEPNDRLDAVRAVSERLMRMIDAFQEQVARADRLLREHFQVKEVVGWRQSGIPKEGYCDAAGSISYCFHGFGCRVESAGLIIDWDYGFGGRIDGFDLWRLQIFAEDSTDQFPEFTDKASLVFVFNLAVGQKLIHQPFLDKNDSLFYKRDVSQ